jgi:hypothetical protein
MRRGVDLVVNMHTIVRSNRLLIDSLLAPSPIYTG